MVTRNYRPLQMHRIPYTDLTEAQVASILGSHQIGISSVIQPEGQEGDAVPLVLIIHDAPFDRMRAAVQSIQDLDCVKATPTLLWVLS